MKFRFPIIATIGLLIVTIAVTVVDRISPHRVTTTIVENSNIGIDLHHIPIGDGRISIAPQIGAVWSCRQEFNDGIGGAYASGNWIHADGTFDFTAKPIVDGRIYWQSKFEILTKNGIRSIFSNRIPQDPTGKFPISPDDDAYSFDRNPNAIRAELDRVNLPALPQVSPTPSCLPLGQIGILVNGGYFFNALDAGGKDAVAHEIQDNCQGHPEITGTYHYHSVTTCLANREPTNKHSALVGYAFDGFGIYGHRSDLGRIVTNADLDMCHGHTHSLEWDGKKVDMYHYHATWEYPYTLGCYRGTPRILPPI